jgi:PilZ domain
MEERRKHVRTPVKETAYISVSGSSIRCQVSNISEQGAAIDVPDVAYIPEHFELMLKSDRIVRNCRIVWIMKNRIGVEFAGDPDYFKSLETTMTSAPYY